MHHRSYADEQAEGVGPSRAGREMRTRSAAPAIDSLGPDFPPRVRTAGRWMTLLLAGAVIGLSCGEMYAQAPGRNTPGMAHANRTAEVWEVVVARVSDATQPAEARIAAVQQILALDQQQPLDALLHQLQSGDVSTQQIVLHAMATYRDNLPARLTQGMYDLLLTETALQRDLSELLGRFDDPRLTRQFVRVAVNPREPLTARRGATQALGHRRSKESVRTLIDLVNEENQVEAVRTTAFDSLRELTGMRDTGNEAESWSNWYAQEQSRSEASWYEHLLTLHARNAARARREHQYVLSRLVDATQQAFRSIPQEERQARLIAMLSDDLEPIRTLATNLCSQRLIDNQPFSEELRAALLARLDDPAVAVQRRAVGLLENLADDRAADIIADRLSSGRRIEQDLLRSYLIMMARLPREAAVDRVMELLGNEFLTDEAAAALVKAWDENLLDQAHRNALARRFAEMRVGQDQPPIPQIIELLGRIGAPEYWPRIEAWMDSSDAAIKRAAALAWAKSDQSLTPLTSRARDTEIQPIAIDAAARRGSSLQEMMPLVHARPDQPQLLKTWEQALISMAQRSGPAALLKVNDELAAAGNNYELREKMLSAVITAFPEVPADGISKDVIHNTITNAPWPDTRWSHLTDLLLRRADLRLKRGDTTAAAADLQRITAQKLASRADQERRLSLALFSTAVAMSRYEDAYTMAQPYFRLPEQAERDEPAQRLIIEAFVAAAQRSVTTDQAVSARKIMDMLILLAPDAVGDLSKQIMKAVETLTQTLRNAQTTDGAAAPSPTAPPSPDGNAG